MHLKNIFLFGWLVCLPGPVLAESAASMEEYCEIIVSKDRLISNIKGDDLQQDEYLDLLKRCLFKYKRFQLQVDTNAVKLMDAIIAMRSKNKISMNVARSAMRLTKGAFLANAELRFASSQHNLATMYNAKKGSLVYRTIEQDYDRFMFWTKAAAAQQEPRALFNLGVRKYHEAVDKDLESSFDIAYILLRRVEYFVGQFPDRFSYIMPYVKTYKEKIRTKLGAEKIQTIEGNADAFDYKILNPVGG